MPKNMKAGDSVQGYEIIRHLNTGGFAISYEAKKVSSGDKVFFKQYKSPSCTVGWYNGYVDYQKELKKRIEDTPATKAFTYKFVDFFEAKFGPKTYFQVFEFVENGHNLEEILQNIRSGRGVEWEQRILMSKVLCAAINALHSVKIVHCDLKPANIQLFNAPELTMKYRLKVIDMDFSILSDREAPWHGKQGYVGSPQYFSPEHLDGKVPTEASDVFTLGLMLYELLGGGHPYPADEEEYKKAVTLHAIHPVLGGGIPGATDKEVACIMHRCLNPDASMRPTAQSVQNTLLGTMEGPKSIPPKPPVSPPAALVPPKRLESLELCNDTGETLKVTIRTPVGKLLVNKFGPDAQFYDNIQYTLEPRDGKWMLCTNAKAQNETLINGVTAAGEIELKEGQILGVGREAKGVVKLPLKVHIT